MLSQEAESQTTKSKQYLWDIFFFFFLQIMLRFSDLAYIDGFVRQLKTVIPMHTYNPLFS